MLISYQACGLYGNRLRSFDFKKTTRERYEEMRNAASLKLLRGNIALHTLYLSLIRNTFIVQQSQLELSFTFPC